MENKKTDYKEKGDKNYRVFKGSIRGLK